MDGASLGILFGLIAMVGYGLDHAIMKVPLKSLGVRKTIFFRNIFLSALLFAVLALFWQDAVFSQYYLLIAVGIALIGYIGLASFAKGLRVGKAGVVTPIANSSLVFTILFAVAFFSEALTPIQLLAIALIIAGIILESVNFRHFKESGILSPSSGIPFALLTCLLWGLIYFLLKIPVTVLGPILTSFVFELGILVFSGAGMLITRKPFGGVNRKMIPYLALVGIFGALGTVFFNLGITYASVSIIAALTAANPLVTVLYGRLAYKDRLNAKQYLALLLMVAGVAAIALY
ncbi:MAG: DMT family transporter [Candidatus Aenigmarchaeota archaeon]|nr:DMT family transporter [Candidatus Aenigmarchaeota archaeon]